MLSKQQTIGAARNGLAARAGRVPVALRHKRALRCRAEGPSSATATPAAPAALFKELDEACNAYKRAPPSMKLEFSADVKATFDALKEAGALPKWGGAVEMLPARRNIMPGELRQMGIKQPDKMAVPSTRNDAAFLATTVGVFSVLAVLLGQLPGDWGFFSSYLTGGVVLVVLAIGSTAPGLLQGIIDQFSQVFPDYRKRVLQHEAAHFLVGYLLGVPVTGYSVAMTREHVEFAEAKIQARIITRDLSEDEVSALAAVAVAGITAEGMSYEEVMGQTADLLDLQRILLRQRPALTNAQQQSATRWAVWAAAMILRRYKAEYEALQEALASGKTVGECVQAIETAKSA